MILHINFEESSSDHLITYDMCLISVCLFICVEALRPSQPNGVISNAVSLPTHTFTRQV